MAFPNVLPCEASSFCCGKRLCCNYAFTRLLTRVDVPVFFQTASVRIVFTALPAIVWLFTRVDTVVPCQITFSRKLPVALPALIRPLTRVGAMVF